MNYAPEIVIGLLCTAVYFGGGHIVRRMARKPVPKPKPKTENTLFNSVSNNKCPDCGSSGFYAGPSGGMTTNIFCMNRECRSGFNFGSFGYCERIQKGDLDQYPPAA